MILFFKLSLVFLVMNASQGLAQKLSQEPSKASIESSKANIVSSKASIESNKASIKKQAFVQQVYSFQPLLIKGKKYVPKKANDLNVKEGKLSESEIFFNTPKNFKKRIFE